MGNGRWDVDILGAPVFLLKSKLVVNTDMKADPKSMSWPYFHPRGKPLYVGTTPQSFELRIVLSSFFHNGKKNDRRIPVAAVFFLKNE